VLNPVPWLKSTVESASTCIRARSNGEVPATVLRGRRFRLPRHVLQPLATAMDRGQLSARGLDRTTRVAWTVADLDGRDRPGVDDVNEALEMRSRRGR